MSTSLIFDYRPRFDCQLTEIAPSCADEILSLADVQEPSLQQQALQAAAARINQSEDPIGLILNLIDAMLRTNRFACTALWQALVRLEPLIENKDALALAASRLYLKQDSIPSFEQAQGALWFAAYTGNVDLAREAIQHGAHVNTLIYPNMTALLLACKRGHDDVACLLLEAGANVKFIGGTHDHETALSEALFRPEKMARSLPRLLALDNGFSDEFHARKWIAHAFSTTTESGESSVEGVSFYLEGYRPRYILDHFLKQSSSFYETLKNELHAAEGSLYNEITAALSEEARTRLKDDAEARQKLCAAIDEMLIALKECLASEVDGMHANPDQMVQNALKRLSEGKPAVCFGVIPIGTEWKTGAPNSHAWGLVIAKDPDSSDEQYIVQRCNRGHGASSFEGILTRKMSGKEVHDLISSYYRAANWKETFLHSGVQIKQEIEAQMQLPGFEHLPEKKQSLGICCYYSAQSIQLALLRALFTPVLGDAFETNLALSKSIKNTCTAQVRSHDLGAYLDKHDGPGSSSDRLHHPDRELLKKIVQKAKGKSKLDRYLAPFSPDLIESLEGSPSSVIRFSSGYGMGREFCFLSTDPVEKLYDFLFNAIPPEQRHWIKALNLSNLGLTALSTEIGQLSGLKTLNLSQNKLSHFDIPELPHLTAIDLSRNSLREFRTSGLPLLEKLTLTQNNLKRAKIEHLPNLTLLNLNKNKLVQIEFDDLPKLSHLYLCENPLKALPPLDMPNLTNLILCENKLVMLPAFNLPNLKILMVKKNRLKAICPIFPPPRVFSWHGNPVLFSFDQKIVEFEDLDDVPNTIHFFKSQKIYSLDRSLCGSLAELYYHLIEAAPESNPDFFDAPVDQYSNALFENLSDGDKERIFACGQKLLEAFDDDLDFEKNDIFESKDVFYAAVHNAILGKYEALSKAERAEIRQQVLRIEQTCFPNKDYTQWTSHPKRNLPRLAIALAERELNTFPAALLTINEEPL